MKPHGVSVAVLLLEVTEEKKRLHQFRQSAVMPSSPFPSPEIPQYLTGDGVGVWHWDRPWPPKECPPSKALEGTENSLTPHPAKLRGPDHPSTAGC